ncbi:MAG: hypothetical protein HC831_18055 [Chloroflexia bacterium]|nr:hypothetical protein [Chloroflexia bacterium]
MSFSKSEGLKTQKVFGRKKYCEHHIFKIKEDKNHDDWEYVKDIKESSYCNDKCPLHSKCEYTKQFNDIPLAIKHQSYLMNPASYWDKESERVPDILIIDEGILGDGFQIDNYLIEDEYLPTVTKYILRKFAAEHAKNYDSKKISELCEYPDLIQELNHVEREDSTEDMRSEIEALFNPETTSNGAKSIIGDLNMELERLKVENKTIMPK